jgi:two-component system sensor kinase FixL
MPLQVHWSWTGLAAGRSRFWATGAVFVVAYFALNLLTEWHEFDRLGITLWSPDDGLSLALLIENAAFAPFVFLAAVLVDLSIAGLHRSLGVTLAAELSLTLTYVGLAFVLKNTLKFDIRQFRLPDVVAFLLLVPVGAALSAFIYCGVLYLGGGLSSDKVFVAMIHCWIGEALGIVTIIPAMTAAFTYASPPWRWSDYTWFTIFIFVLGIGLGFAALVGVGDKLYYLFNLLFLPVIWVAMREGYAGVALALVTIQLTLAVLTAFVGYNTTDFAILQLLMLVLSITGLLLGAVTTERQDAAVRLREQKRELQASRASEPVIDALIKAEAEAQRAREVLERIRDFVSNGNLNLTAVDVRALADKIGELCREEAAARGVLVEVESMGFVPPVEADGIQIEQVLINLVANAIDAAAERSDARGRVTMRVAAKDNAIMLRVEDNGHGVAPELADNIFDAYQTTKPRGMGLGLHLSRRIVQRHAGRLWWEPIATGGARFVVELPIHGCEHNAA